jgi:excisionase family DNA binding protein
MTLITLDEAAKRLAVSRQTIYRMLQANDYRARILAGEIAESDVPKAIRLYLHHGFPPARRVSERVLRIESEALDAWLACFAP